MLSVGSNPTSLTMEIIIMKFVIAFITLSIAIGVTVKTYVKRKNKRN